MEEKLEHDIRPWGEYWVLSSDEKKFKIKKIVVYPGGRLSLQYHQHRSEVWTIVEGTGIVTLNDEIHEISAGEVIKIPQGAHHRIANYGDENLIFIEVQLGTYFGEDDIVRIEDDYKRD